MIINKEKNFISAVFYVRDNEEEIENFLISINKIFYENFENYEIIFVNDASRDCTVSKIESEASRINGSVISIINMSYYQGIELSMTAGMDLAIGDFVFEFDNVMLDYPIESIMNIYKRALEGFDIVSVAPEKNTNFVSKLFYDCFNKFSNYPYQLRTESFRVVSRRAINRVYAMNKTVPYRKAIYVSCGLAVDTIVYKKMHEKKDLKMKKSGSKQTNLAVNSLILFTDIAYKITIILTIVMMFMAIGVSAYALFIFLGTSKPVEGWTTTMLFLSFSFFGVFAIFAVIIKYLNILVDLIFGKQKYLIESIKKISN